MAFQEFTASVSYSAGEYVWLDRTLFRFVEDHSAGAWTGKDVQKVSAKHLINMLDEIQDEIDAAEESLADYANAIVTSATGSTATFTDGAAYNAVEILVAIDPDDFSGVYNTSSLNHSGADTSNPDTITVTWSENIHAGQWNVTTGVLTVYKYIASYNGETLVGPWASSLDTYAEGTSPTTGAKVVDYGTVSAEYQLNPYDVVMLSGTNKFWSNTGNVTVTYRADTLLYIEAKTAEIEALILES